MSMNASGTLGDVLTFGKVRKTSTLRKKPTPAQPRTGLQVSMRAMMQFISQQWRNLTAPDQATWGQLAVDAKIAPYHAFIAHNMQRWRNLRPPSKQYPVTETDDASINPSVDATGGVRHIQIKVYENTMIVENWTFLLFHKLDTPPAAELNKLVHVFRVENYDDHYWTHTPLQPGSHYYRVIPTSDDGNVDWARTDTDAAIVT